MAEPYLAETNEALDPETWLERHGDHLYRYALARLNREQPAEDLVQETFLAAWQARERFEGASSERTWLIGILKHKIVDYLRKKGREQPLSSISENDSFLDDLFDRHGHWKKSVRPAPSPGAVFERREFWETLSNCMGKLPENLAEVFALRDIDGGETADICANLKITPANLWVMLHRARLRLWRCLDIHWFGRERTGP